VLATHDTFLLLTELDQSLKKLQQERNELGGETLTTRTMNSFQIFWRIRIRWSRSGVTVLGVWFLMCTKTYFGSRLSNQKQPIYLLLLHLLLVSMIELLPWHNQRNLIEELGRSVACCMLLLSQGHSVWWRLIGETTRRAKLGEQFLPACNAVGIDSIHNYTKF